MQSDLSAQKCRNMWKKAHFGNVSVTVLDGHLCSHSAGSFAVF